MTYAADFAVFPFADGSNFRRSFVTKIRRLHPLVFFESVSGSVLLQTLLQQGIHPVVVFIPCIVGGARLFLFFLFRWCVDFGRICRLEGVWEILAVSFLFLWLLRLQYGWSKGFYFCRK